MLFVNGLPPFKPRRLRRVLDYAGPGILCANLWFIGNPLGMFCRSWKGLGHARSTSDAPGRAVFWRAGAAVAISSQKPRRGDHAGGHAAGGLALDPAGQRVYWDRAVFPGFTRRAHIPEDDPRGLPE